MSATTPATEYREGQPCPEECGHPLVWCEGDDEHGRHLICLGCGEDAGECDYSDCVEWDLGTCPFYARSHQLPGHDPKGTCSFACQEEPACITCEPENGWPSRRTSP